MLFDCDPETEFVKGFSSMPRDWSPHEPLFLLRASTMSGPGSLRNGTSTRHAQGGRGVYILTIQPYSCHTCAGPQLALGARRRMDWASGLH